MNTAPLQNMSVHIFQQWVTYIYDLVLKGAQMGGQIFDCQ